MTTRSIMKITALSAVLAVSSLWATAQAADTGWTVIAQSSDSSSSAGDGDRPITYPNKNFGDLDKNKDGLLDKKEQVSTVDGRLLKAMDTNADGYVSQSEWDAYTSSKKTSPVSGNQITP